MYFRKSINQSKRICNPLLRNKDGSILHIEKGRLLNYDSLIKHTYFNLLRRLDNSGKHRLGYYVNKISNSDFMISMKYKEYLTKYKGDREALAITYVKFKREMIDDGFLKKTDSSYFVGRTYWVNPFYLLASEESIIAHLKYYGTPGVDYIDENNENSVQGWRT